MRRQPSTQANAFFADERGSVAVIFSLVLVVVVVAAGVGLDFTRVMHTRAGLVAAADAAALAGGRALGDGSRSDAQIRSLALAYFKENLGSAEAFGDVDDLEVAIDRAAGKVRVDVSAKVPMTLTRVAGFDSMTVPVMAETATSSRDIELAMVLDVTGSMAGSKIADLRDAAAELVDQMLDGAPRPGRVRIGLAPYADSVNAGSYFRAATGRNNGSGCVIERSGSARFEEEAPRAGRYVGYKANVACPSATVQALTDNKSTLQSKIRALRDGGRTAGHIGAAWGWYLVSPEWSSFWPADSAPAAYDDRKTVKAVLLMTDGAFNQQYADQNGRSATQARALCRNMKDAGVVVYSVAFEAGSEAEALLRECASASNTYFVASNGAALGAAFQAIGRSLTDLHLTQ